MEQKVNTGDFIEVEYSGRIKEDSMLFDTTSAEAAKKEGIFSENMEYGPAIICVGQRDVLKGLDERIIGAEIGKEYSFNLAAEEAFGKKDVKLIQLIPTKKFTEQNVRPMPGLQINVDGHIGVVKTAAGGRTLVDFNHPLSGKELTYDIKILRIITDRNEKIKSLFKLHLNLNADEIKIEDNNVLVPLKPQFVLAVQNNISQKVKDLVLPELEVKFIPPEKGNKNK